MTWSYIFSKTHKRGYRKVKEKLSKRGFKGKPFKTFHVVGTNGKGSVSQYLNDSYIAKGLKVGLFTSPHIFKPNERIKINNVPIKTKKFFKLAKGLKGFSFFETFFIVAMEYFKENNIDIAIIEAGIGGRSDATHAVESDFATVTSISFDHTDLLGSTIEAIAKEKDGIRSENTIFYIPTLLPEEAKKVFMHDQYKLIENNAINYKEQNILLASKILEQHNISPIINEVFGRTTILKVNNKNAIVDVAHNIPGIKASLDYLKSIGVDYERVILTIRKSKLVYGLKELFPNKKLFIYQLNDKYYSADELGLPKVDNLEQEFKNQKVDTLYIGTFRTLEYYAKDK